MLEDAANINRITDFGGGAASVTLSAANSLGRSPPALTISSGGSHCNRGNLTLEGVDPSDSQGQDQVCASLSSRDAARTLADGGWHSVAVSCPSFLSRARRDTDSTNLHNEMGGCSIYVDGKIIPKDLYGIQDTDRDHGAHLFPSHRGGRERPRDAQGRDPDLHEFFSTESYTTSSVTPPGDRFVLGGRKPILPADATAAMMMITSDRPLGGWIDEFRVYDAALTEEEAWLAHKSVEPFVLHQGEHRTDLCGNRRLSVWHSCDDGNQISGDGCSRHCEIERDVQCESVFYPCIHRKSTIQ